FCRRRPRPSPPMSPTTSMTSPITACSFGRPINRCCGCARCSTSARIPDADRSHRRHPPRVPSRAHAHAVAPDPASHLAVGVVLRLHRWRAIRHGVVALGTANRRKIMKDIVLSASERDLLLWLSEEAFSQYGECHGDAFEKLVSLGLAQVHGPGEHQEDFAAS